MFLFGLIVTILLYKKEEKKLAIISLIISIIISSSIIGYAYYVYEIYDPPNELEYELKIETDTNWDYVLYVPYLKNDKLESKIDIQSGEGNIEFIDIVEIQVNGSNRALKVEHLGDMTIYGETQDNGNFTMTMKKDRIRTYWVWCNKTNPNQNISIQINARVDGYGSYWSTSNDHVINEGWNEIEIKHVVED